MKPLDQYEVWFLTGSQELYGEATLAPGRGRLGGDRALARCGGGHPGPDRRTGPCFDSAEAIATAIPRPMRRTRCVGVIAWMHTFSPARMWIAGSARSRPLLHLHTQFNRDLPWAEIDMDFMNLHQAAHGDREFGFIETACGVARKTVVGHWEDPRVPARIGAWARAAADGTRPDTCASPASATTCVTSPTPRATRSRRRSGSASTVNGYPVSELADAVAAAPDARGRRRARRLRRDYEVAPELRRRWRPARRAARGGPDRGGVAVAPDRRRVRRLHRHVRGPRRPPASCRASPSSG